jgi:hypothetical protein
LVGGDFGSLVCMGKGQYEPEDDDDDDDDEFICPM